MKMEDNLRTAAFKSKLLVFILLGVSPKLLHSFFYKKYMQISLQTAKYPSKCNQTALETESSPLEAYVSEKYEKFLNFFGSLKISYLCFLSFENPSLRFLLNGFFKKLSVTTNARRN